MTTPAEPTEEPRRMYHSLLCTEEECDPGVDGDPGCPFNSYAPPA